MPNEPLPVAAFVVALTQGTHSPGANESATALQRDSRPPDHSYLQHTPPLRLLKHLTDIEPKCSGKVGERIPFRAGPLGSSLRHRLPAGSHSGSHVSLNLCYAGHVGKSRNSDESFYALESPPAIVTAVPEGTALSPDRI
jgi:hypothetical protein